MKQQQVAAGSVIFHEGEESHEAYRIISGRVTIRIDAGGQPLRLAELGPGDIFGEMAMVDEKPRSATAEAAAPCVLEVMTPDEFNHLILENPQALLPYLSVFFERLRTANDRLRHELQKQAKPGVVTTAERHRFVPPPPRRETAAAPSASKHAVTLEAIGDAAGRCEVKSVAIDKFPFRLGRATDGKVANVFAANDYLIRDERPFEISRNHCSIEREGDEFFVRDRGSTLGTWANGERIGVHEASLVAPLKIGANEVLLGSSNSPYRFHVTVA